MPNPTDELTPSIKLPRPVGVKNKTPAKIQITADQIVRDASDLQECEIRPQKEKIVDATELGDYRLRKRKEFEDSVRRAPSNKSVWVKYAKWEESQKDFARARSVWERALQVDYKDHTMWLRYASSLMKNKFLNHARNVFDRATNLLPRVDQIWYKYVHMEEMLGNFAGVRKIFERWVNWSPEGWTSYIDFELRHNEVGIARTIFGRFVVSHPKVSHWIKFADFEMKYGDMAGARSCYERAVDIFGGDYEEAKVLFMAFAEFEMKCNEVERARCIFKYALDHIPKAKAEDIHTKYVAFEKQSGDRELIDDLISENMILHYEDELSKDPLNYDLWFDYIRVVEETCGDKKKIEGVYERAVSIIPPAQEKHYWQKYIYLWINYALYEELDAQDIQRTRDVYNLCLKIIPHEKFSFAKLWLMAAKFEIRQLNIDRARKYLGSAIGIAPKDKIFKKYIEIELQLGNVERCRILYAKYVEWSPENCYAWIKFAEFEVSLGETERARALFELAIDQPALDMPEMLWKAYIDFEISESEYERSRVLYERLLDRTKHLKVWISYAEFEASAMGKGFDESDVPEQKRKCLERARAVYERGLSYLRTCAPELKEERAMLLEEWSSMESSFGELGDVDLVRVKLPQKLKRRRHIETDYDEYVDYLFPEEKETTNQKILEAAYKWKKKQKSL